MHEPPHARPGNSSNSSWPANCRSADNRKSSPDHVEHCPDCVQTLHGLGKEDTLAEVLLEPSTEREQIPGRRREEGLIERLHSLPRQVVTEAGAAPAEVSTASCRLPGPAAGSRRDRPARPYRVLKVLGPAAWASSSRPRIRS